MVGSAGSPSRARSALTRPPLAPPSFAHCASDVSQSLRAPMLMATGDTPFPAPL